MEQMIRNGVDTLKPALKRLWRDLRPVAPGCDQRPIGEVRMFLEDVRARGFRPRGIMDIGANRGRWTLMALSIFPQAEVIMVEPQDEFRSLLESICGTQRNVHFISAGAGKEPGQLVQTIWDDLDGSSFLPPVCDESLRAGKQRLTQIVTMDEILRERTNFAPDLVKLDIQGFELEALKGAVSLFGRTELFILETSLFSFMPGMPTIRECVEFMHERGYAFYDMTGFLRRPYDGALAQVDLAFAKSGGGLRGTSQWAA
jgi:FkbM family methyltransferase